MTPVPPVRTFWIVLGLIFGFIVVLAGPVLLFWDALDPHPWNENNLKAEFQSVRYESGGLIFCYSVHNLTRYAAQFEPTLTEVHALQSKDRPPVGAPNVLLPFNVPARGSHVVEVRLELQNLSPASALPMRQPDPPPSPQEGDAVDFVLQDTLSYLDGFELIDGTNGIRLVLPRAW